MAKPISYNNPMDKKLYKKIKKEHSKAVIATAFSTTYLVEQLTSATGDNYYAIFNDCWPEMDTELVKPDPCGRMILRSYGAHMARMLLMYKEIIDSVYEVNNTTYSIHDNDDIIVYNSEYRIRFSKNINAIPVEYKTIQ